ncbi:leucine-rich repeat protein [Megavirus chiliensis]|uniref:Leucine-rich repeat n=2 Tax=Megamimivirinae TaxID=3044648 RepID=A0A2L2DME4_MIMIV|nr:putative leucine-rich repeat protein [Megavirus chiliensis]AEQ33054.1 leucine-rich repeat protein [Megavirus chiliensis]AVG47353.1 leucine-rich repeat [Acanthamoeba polyphaga mimivirus]
MHAKSHRYPDNDDIETDTTYYDEKEKYFDLGYQRLKYIDINIYPEFTYLKKLFLNNNSLKNLPNPKYLPHLKKLICSNNKLDDIPFYPKIVYLDISYNKITNCKNYNNSKIKYLDCSYNPNFIFDFNLPYCQQLYINDNKLTNINLDLCPNVEILDCSNNLLTKINGGINLIEISIQDNNIDKLPIWSKLLRLMANNNKLLYLDTYPELIYLSASFNNLQLINDQPKLKKIIVNNNHITRLGKMPNLKLIDLSHNLIKTFVVPKYSKYVSIQFNSLDGNQIDNDNIFEKLREFQMDFNIYVKIYNICQKYITSINIQINQDRLTKHFKKISHVFNDNIINVIFNKLNGIEFPKRNIEIYQVSLDVFKRFFNIKQQKDNDIVKMKEFTSLQEIITKSYYENMIITMWFNNYC